LAGKTVRWEWYSLKNERTYDLIDTPLKNPDGSISKLEIFRDITERKRAEEERERLLAELEAKNRELESFVYTVSHDLKAPLVSLDGFSSVLQKEFYDQLGEQGKHYLERIQANVAHMDALIVDLLELSRIGRVVGPIEEIDVAALLREIQEELAVKLEEAGAEFVVQEPLPAVRADRGRIRQVFANLIDNAVKFRSEERPLRIEVGCQEEEGLYRFHVADNGIGIAPQYQEQIFGPFQQLDAGTEGVGMGLALVNKIVEHHGGRVWVESKSGKGSTFYFTLEWGMRNDSTIRIPNSTFEGGER
jgi:signal transduction histidine kinase